MPILFISGYADFGGNNNDQLPHQLVRKPFRPADLRAQIEAALAETRVPAGPAGL